MEEKNLKIVENELQKFYKKRVEKLENQDIFKILKRKNPYLYRAFGTNDANEFVRDLLSDTQTSSDETMFGEFFESVAIGVSLNGRKSSGDSIDLEVWSEDEKSVKLYAVKSGVNVFNAQSNRRQQDAFNEAIRRLKGIAIQPIVGYSYGRKSSKINKKNYEEKAGEVFWEDITGDKNFYKKLIDMVGFTADRHKEEFVDEWNKCKNRLYKKFMDVFGNEDGSINWHNIIEYNSAKDIPKEISKKIRMVNKGLK